MAIHNIQPPEPPTPQVATLEQERLRRLYELSTDVGGATEDRIRQTLETGLEMFDLDIGIVSQVVGDSYTLVHVHAPGFDLTPGQTFPLGQTYCDMTLTAGDVIAIHHMKSSENAGHPCYQAFSLEAYIGVPFYVEDELFGTLNFSSPRPAPRSFSPADCDLIRLMGRWVGSVLGQDKVQNQLEAYRHHLEQLVNERTENLNRANKSLLAEIRERTEAEEALRNNLSFLEVLIDTIPAPVFYKDRQCIYRGCNAAFAETILGLPKADIIGNSVFDLPDAIDPNLADIYHAQDLKLLANPKTQAYEAPVQCADGRQREFIFTKAVYNDSAGDPAGIVGVMIDITARKRSEATLARLISILETTSDFISTSTPEGRLTYINRAGRKMLGWRKDEDLDKKHIPDAHPPWAFDVVKNTGIPEAISTGIWAGETALLNTEGEEIPVSQVIMSHKSDEGRLQYLSTIIRDISDIKKAQDEHIVLQNRLRQAQKMESIGTLAGGIAHDFNNILSAVLGYTEITMQELAADATSRSHLAKVLKAGKRARDLIRQILTFSRQGDHEVKPIKLKTIIKEVLHLLRASLPVTITIEQDLVSETAVMADPTHIHQTIMNLCTNAGQAMEKNGGHLHVSLKDRSIATQSRHQQSDLAPGEYVELKVRDTGHGMTDKVRERIFDPFFTTKPKSRGTGMGLSVVHGIVMEMNGAIDVESDPGVGTTFTLFLPAIEDEPVEPVEAPRTVRKGTESILLVDDEDYLAELGQTMLEDLGYTVTACTDSHQALERFTRSPDRFDLVITDMTMPLMTGDRLIRQIRKIRPDIPAVICTGFSAQMDQRKAESMGIQGFITKPILQQQLSETIRDILDRFKQQR